MARYITSLFSAALLWAAISGCNQMHKHNHAVSCSNMLPTATATDSLHLFTASASTINSFTCMVLIPAGEFSMGALSTDTFARTDEKPIHKVQVDSFWMDATEVTNKQFKAFVNATGYLTTAERLQPSGSLVFIPNGDGNGNLFWWKYTNGADWQHPLGVGSSIDTMDNYPVIHVSWYDAMAYASWVGKRLPTEAEWEYAARSGGVNTLYPWGSQNPETERRANVFQGEFPIGNTAKDGYKQTAPVSSFKPNAFGLYDMSGNVWEWCADYYHERYYEYCTENEVTRPAGPEKSFNPEDRFGEYRVMRGGSFMCNSSYCTGYRSSARNKTTPSTSLMNVGFRCVRSVTPRPQQ